jgi:cobalt-zinc-cadmium efflux system outer membrane protein
MRRLTAPVGAALAGLGLASAAVHAAPSDCPAAVPVPLTLAAAEQRLEPCNRDVRAARLALRLVSADRRIAAQRPNPTLTAGASNVNPQVGLGSGTLRDKTFDSSLRLEQLVERGGKAGLRVAQANAFLAAARADLHEQIRVQRMVLRSTYFDLAAAQERVRLQRDFQSLAAESANAAKRRFEAGEISRAEANRFRLDAARVGNDVRQAIADVQRARLELAKAIGAEAAASALEVEAVFPDHDGVASRGGERPDVSAARRRVEAAEAGRDLAKSLATRDVVVGLQAERWPASDFNTQGTGISYGLTLSIPLHVRHANEGEAQRGVAELDAARTMLDRVQAQAAAEARLAEEDWRVARERRQRVESEIRPAARDVAQAAEFAYARGATGVLDLLDARRSLKAVELDEVQARAEAAKAWARREGANETAEEETP